jgi:predicted glycosyltransferase involved in capsule biosynthesis
MITFITHIRYDSDDRVNNLQTTLNYYSQNLPDSKFIIVEDDEHHNIKLDSIKWPKGTSFYLIKNSSYYFRTRALNYGINKVTTPICVSLDADCIVSIEAIKETADILLHNSKIVIAWPYTYVIDTPKYAHNDFINSRFNYTILKNFVPSNITRESIFNEFRVWTDIDRPSVGGVVMFRTDNIKAVKGYNEKFIAWGYEDNELHYRITTLGYSEYRTNSRENYCFHLRHSNTIRDNSPFYIQNHEEVTKVTNMNRAEILSYIEGWNEI